MLLLRHQLFYQEQLNCCWDGCAVLHKSNFRFRLGVPLFNALCLCNFWESAKVDSLGNIFVADTLRLPSPTVTYLAPKLPNHPNALKYRKIMAIVLCAVQGHSRSPLSIPIEISYATSYVWMNNSNLHYILSRTVCKIWWIVGQNLDVDGGVSLFNALAQNEPPNNNNNNNNLRLILVKTNPSTLHTVCNIQQSATQGSNDTTHRQSHRTAATARFWKAARKTAPSYMPTIRSGGPLPRKHSPDGATSI